MAGLEGTEELLSLWRSLIPGEKLVLGGGALATLLYIWWEFEEVKMLSSRPQPQRQQPIRSRAQVIDKKLEELSDRELKEVFAQRFQLFEDLRGALRNTPGAGPASLAGLLQEYENDFDDGFVYMLDKLPMQKRDLPEVQDIAQQLPRFVELMTSWPRGEEYKIELCLAALHKLIEYYPPDEFPRQFADANKLLSDSVARLLARKNMRAKKFDEATDTRLKFEMIKAHENVLSAITKSTSKNDFISSSLSIASIAAELPPQTLPLPPNPKNFFLIGARRAREAIELMEDTAPRRLQTIRLLGKLILRAAIDMPDDLTTEVDTSSDKGKDKVPSESQKSSMIEQGINVVREALQGHIDNLNDEKLMGHLRKEEFKSLEAVHALLASAYSSRLAGPLLLNQFEAALHIELRQQTMVLHRSPELMRTNDPAWSDRLKRLLYNEYTIIAEGPPTELQIQFVEDMLGHEVAVPEELAKKRPPPPPARGPGKATVEEMEEEPEEELAGDTGVPPSGEVGERDEEEAVVHEEEETVAIEEVITREEDREEDREEEVIAYGEESLSLSEVDPAVLDSPVPNDEHPDQHDEHPDQHDEHPDQHDEHPEQPPAQPEQTFAQPKDDQ